MTTRNRFLKMCDKTSSPPDIIIRRCFSPTSRDKSAVWALFGLVGYEPPPILSRHTGRNRARQVFSLLIASTISLTAKGETSDKRAPLGHHLCLSAKVQKKEQQA